jgi:hypothetical protein
VLQYLTVEELAQGWIDFYSQDLPPELMGTIGEYGEKRDCYADILDFHRWFEGLDEEGRSSFGS